MNIIQKFTSFTSRILMKKHDFIYKGIADKIVFNAAIKPRTNQVPTHRGELLPFTINNLWDNPGARHYFRRVGRGQGSTKGQTCGRGTKGDNSRSGGGVHPRFEGGQSPLQRRLPKMGIRRIRKQRPTYLNLDKIMYVIHSGRLDATKPITLFDLWKSGAISRVKYGIQILSKGAEKIDRPLHFEVSDASERAIKSIKEKGGSIKCIYRTQLQVQEIIQPQLFPFKLRGTIPPKRIVKQMENIRERGAEVEYNIPNWYKPDLETKLQETQEDKKAKAAAFDLPIKTPHGQGQNVIRKRQPQIWKEVNLGLQ